MSLAHRPAAAAGMRPLTGLMCDPAGFDSRRSVTSVGPECAHISRGHHVSADTDARNRHPAAIPLRGEEAPQKLRERRAALPHLGPPRPRDWPGLLPRGGGDVNLPFPLTAIIAPARLPCVAFASRFCAVAPFATLTASREGAFFSGCSTAGSPACSRLLVAANGGPTTGPMSARTASA